MKTTTNNGSVIDLEPGNPAAAGCNCWVETDAKLNAMGYRIATSLSCLSWQKVGSLPVTWILPLEKADGKKVKRSEPGSIQMSHCPFCGQKYP